MINQFEKLQKEKERINKMSKKQLIGSIGYHIRCCKDCDYGGSEYPCFYECIGALNYKRDSLNDMEE